MKNNSLIGNIPKQSIYNIQGFENPSNGYVQNLSELAAYANLNEDNRVLFCTSLAAVSRGKDESNNPDKRYKQLLREASPWLASDFSPILDSEFINEENKENNPVLDQSRTDKIKINNLPITLYQLGKHKFSFSKIVNEEDFYIGGEKTGRPSRPLEFIPVILKIAYGKDKVSIYLPNGLVANCSSSYFHNSLGRFGHIRNDDKDSPFVYLYTNLRAVISSGLPYNYIPYSGTEKSNSDLRYCNYKVYKLRLPMFVFNHFITHTMLSKEARSERMVRLSDCNYWLPDDIIEKLKNYNPKNANSELVTEISGLVETMLRHLELTNEYSGFINLLINFPAYSLMETFKALGYPKEIYQRSMLEFRYKDVIMAGWNEPHSWINFLKERGGYDNISNWVQKETAMVTKVISKIHRGI